MIHSQSADNKQMQDQMTAEASGRLRHFNIRIAKFHIYVHIYSVTAES